MQTISINLYTFGELAPEVQKKVVERERSINVDDSFWYEPIIEDNTEQLEQLGFEQVKIWFTGFGSQGDGACFTATVNIEQFLSARGLDGTFPEVINAAKHALLWVTIRHTYRYYFATSTDVQIQYDGDQDIDDALERLRRIIEDARAKLGNTIYKALEEEFFHEISNEAVQDTLILDEYTYLSDGTRFRVPAPA
jgi:hypothetical protein